MLLLLVMMMISIYSSFDLVKACPETQSKNAIFCASFLFCWLLGKVQHSEPYTEARKPSFYKILVLYLDNRILAFFNPFTRIVKHNL